MSGDNVYDDEELMCFLETKSDGCRHGYIKHTYDECRATAERATMRKRIDCLVTALNRISAICSQSNGNKNTGLLRRIAAARGPGWELCEIELITQEFKED